MEGYRKKNRRINGTLLTRISINAHIHTNTHTHTLMYTSHPMANSLYIGIILWEINHISIGW